MQYISTLRITVNVAVIIVGNGIDTYEFKSWMRHTYFNPTLFLDYIINITGTRFNHFENVALKFSALDSKHFDNIDCWFEYIGRQCSSNIIKQVQRVLEFMVYTGIAFLSHWY